jgi:hypothetical protein
VIITVAISGRGRRSSRAVAPGIDGQVMTTARAVAIALVVMGVSAIVVLNTAPIH